MAYVYRHIRLDKNVPFYIGISKKDDADYSRAYEFKRKYRSDRWYNVFNKTKIEVEIIFDHISFEFAKEKEKEFISMYKRKEDGGTLVNLTLGGDGKPGCKNPSLSERNKLGIWRGKRHSPESRIRISQSNMGKKHSKESKRKMSLAGKQRVGNKNSNYRGFVYAYKGDRLVDTFQSVKDASNTLQMNETTISSIITGKRRPTRGYYFSRIKRA